MFWENQLRQIKKDEKFFIFHLKEKILIKKSKRFSKEKVINLICGHFEGVDERILNTRNIEK